MVLVLSLASVVVEGPPPPTSEVGESALMGFHAMLIMVVLAVTGEYRHRTIRAAFLAGPRRTRTLLVKAAVLAVVAGALGLVLAAGARLVLAAVRPEVTVVPVGAFEWRATLGVAPVFALGALVAVAAGILLRNTAGAVGALLLWPIAEALLTLVPAIAEQSVPVTPLIGGVSFLVDDGVDPRRPMFDPPPISGPWAGLVLYTVFAAVVLAAALFVAERRDA